MKLLKDIRDGLRGCVNRPVNNDDNNDDNNDVAFGSVFFK